MNNSTDAAFDLINIFNHLCVSVDLLFLNQMLYLLNTNRRRLYIVTACGWTSLFKKKRLKKISILYEKWIVLSTGKPYWCLESCMWVLCVVFDFLKLSINIYHFLKLCFKILLDLTCKRWELTRYHVISHHTSIYRFFF